MTGSDADFARWIGVHKSTVSRARRAGRLVLAADGKVEFEASAARWHETAGGRTDVAARHAAHRGAGIPMGQDVSENAPEAPETRSARMGDSDIGSDSRAKAKAALLHYENSAIKLEMALRRGYRLPIGAVRDETAGIGAMLRAGIERVVDQTAPRLAACKNDLQRRQIVAEALRRLKWIIKREIPRGLRRMKERGA